MRKIWVLTLCLFLIFTVVACTKKQTEPTGSVPTSTATSTTATAAPTGTSTAATSSSAATTTTAAATTATTAATSSATSAPTTAATTASTGPTVRMYSSYAHISSYDPARGLADFDYFNMLRGDDAVEYLVEHEGYTLAAAQALVDDFADSEFVEQNDNPQLRTVDLATVDLKLMYYADGTMVAGAEPVDSELIDLYNLYHVNPDLVMDSFFFYVVVSGGVVTEVRQVYWP